MDVVSRGTAIVDGLPLGHAFSWPDPDIDCTLVVSRPSADPGLWSEFLAGAYRSYRKHGVLSALNAESLRNGTDTIMFSAVVDDAGEVVGGLRARGPLRSADDSHAVVEWGGQTGQQAVRKMITDRIPFGVLEMKTGWVIDDPQRARSLTNAVARSGLQMMVILDAQFCMFTAATSVLDRWRSSGAVVAAIPATPYPDERYRTRMLWWNRRDFFNHAQPDQVAKILAETELLLHELYRRGGVGAFRSAWGSIAHGRPTGTAPSEVA